VRVDTATNFAYITNSSEGGIVVIDLASGKKRQVLQGNPSVIASPFYKLSFGGKQLKYDNGQPLRFNSDGIALTPDGKYVYYKPLSDDRLYRIATKYLRNFSLAAQQLAAHVEFMGHYTTTDGMIFDKKGNLYFGDLENYRIIRIKPNGSVEQVVKDKRLIWPDSYSISPDGYLYVSCSQIQLQPEYNLTEQQPTTPYTIYKININD
jgi:sugar lactone lactonase YvrE